MLVENLLFTHQQDEKGIVEGDRLHISPLSGRSFEMKLLRLSYDFISPDRDKPNSWSKELGVLRNESFHVRIFEQMNMAFGNCHKKRFKLKVIEGSAVRLNGTWVMEAFLENFDTLEIGHNTLKFFSTKKTDVFDKKPSFLMKNKRAIKSNLNILLVGETGVGKSSIAKAIHENSGKRGNFIHVNLSSFSPTLIESELFGHVKGAFTGAIKDKVGAIERSNHGTLFIDEVDSLPLDIQTKLLLFLDNLTATAVGANKEYKVNTRLIFSSGQDLLKLVERGEFRKDFYYRISSGQIFNLKSLRDEPKLIEEYCLKFEYLECVKISKKLIEFYKSLPWPGNYRQLKGHLNRKLILSPSNLIDFDEVDEALIEQSSELFKIDAFNSDYTLKEVKLAYAKKVYVHCKSDLKAASKKLGVSSRMLRNLVMSQ